MTPEVFGEHLLIGRVDARSMAEVFLAVRLGDRSGRVLVLKRPPLDERASGPVAEALRREAAALAGLDLPGVVRLVDHGEVAGLPFLVTEHVRGASLARLLSRGHADRALASAVGASLARVLERLHQAGWVHGDLSPGNVLVDDVGELVLVDFGLALRSGEARPGPSGTAGYAAPDAALGKPAQPADDVYGWAVVVAECALGRPLFAGERDLAEAATRSGELPADLAAIGALGRALAPSADKRPGWEELRADPLFAAQDDGLLAERVAALGAEGGASVAPAQRPASARGTSAQPVVRAISAAPAVAPPPPAPRRRPLGVALALIALLGASFLAGGALGRRSAKRDIKTTITLPMVPARAELELDGKRMIVPEAGRPMPIEPGKHTLSVQVGKREAEEYEFVVEPGDHLLIVPVSRLSR